MGYLRNAVIILLVGVLLSPILNIGFDESQLKGKKVIVTGASQGIGAEIALFHCSHGSEVVILARNLERMEDVVSKCSALGAVGAHYLKVDLDSVSEKYFEEVIEKAVNLLGNKLDYLYLNHIYGGAYFKEGFYGKLDLPQSVSMLNVNYLSYVGLAHFATPYLEQSKGRIIVVGSVAGRSGLPNIAMYSGTKHAVFGYFESLRTDYTRVGSEISITTCTIGSIGTKTAMQKAKDVVPDYMWQDPAECGKAIVVGGYLRKRDVFFPISQTYPTFLLRIFPSFLDFIAVQIAKH